ncbi:MAG: TetR/AcrR family transcriptional regulator [Sutterella wadsworthensis]
MSEIENDAAEDVSYEDNEKHVVRRRANGRATRLKILAAARVIIIEKGTDSLSIDRVIKEAGVSREASCTTSQAGRHLIEALVNEYAAHLGEVQTGLTNKAKSDCPMLEAYAEWYKGLHVGRNRQRLFAARCTRHGVKREPEVHGACARLVQALLRSRQAGGLRLREELWSTPSPTMPSSSTISLERTC